MGEVIYLKKSGVREMNVDIDNNRRDNISKIVEEVMNSYGIVEFPVEPTVIAERLNIPIKQVTFKKHNGYMVSGGIIKENEHITIYINSKEPMQRKRFTIAHELGHYFLNHMNNKGQYVDLHREKNCDDSLEEIDADEFAACLLMPEEVIKDKFKILDVLGFNKDIIINRLSAMFYVSQSAMRHRLFNLSLIK